MIKKQNNQYKKFLKNGCLPETKVRVDKFRNDCFEAINAAKKAYLDNMGNKLIDSKSSPKTYWKILKKVMNKSCIPRLPPVLLNNKLIINCKEKAQCFNTFFLTHCQPNINNSVLPLFSYLTDSRVGTIQFTNDEIKSIILSLNPHKSQGCDNISIQVLQLCADSIHIPLGIIFRKILETGIFPEKWKLANVTPIHKKGDKQLISNYRPISLLPVCSKIFEKIIFNNLYSYLVTNNLISANQSGFRPGDSTTNQLLYLVHMIHLALDEQKEVRSVFLDISKAFDKVWHEGLLFKLKQNGIEGNLLKLLESYLSNRNQRVVINGFESAWGVIGAGVPQGSVLGPLLFLIYINDLENGIKSNVKFFADDTSLFSIVSNPTLSADELNADLNEVGNWANQWKMSFNPDPTKQAVEMLFSRKKLDQCHPPLFFNNRPVVPVNDHKHLGIILDCKLFFTKHICEKVAKSRKGIGIIRHLSPHLPLATLDQLYKMFVRPHLDYCDIIYHIPIITNLFDSTTTLSYSMQSIESTQYQAALAITGAWRGSNTSKLYEELGWESLTDRRWYRRLLQLYKIIHDFSPSYLKEFIPPQRRTLYGRHRSLLHEIRCRTSTFMNSFFPDTIRSWNQIGNEFTSIMPISQFKNSLISLIRPNKKSIFRIHNYAGISKIFQLRLGLSDLKSHKRCHNFADTQSDVCACNVEAETSIHFFCRCSLFATQRISLVDSVSVVLAENNLPINTLHKKDLVKIYLYGSSNFVDNDNRVIILAAIKFIVDSKRFEMAEQ